MIRHAKKEDIPRLAEILVFGKRVVYRSIFHDDKGTFHELQVVKVIDEYCSCPERIGGTLVYDDGIVKGLIRGRDCGDEMELCEFYVEPFFKGEGIGRMLMQAFIKNAETDGKKRIFLWVLKDNLSARRFYERNGFLADGREKYTEGTEILELGYERIFRSRSASHPAAPFEKGGSV